MKRPAKKVRDFDRTRREILIAAFGEVYARGFQGVAIDDIVKKTSLTKGALYHQFPTKLDLGYALVDEVIKPMILERWIRPLAEYENPLEGILDRMEKLIGKAEPASLRLGCPLNNLVQEMAPVDAGFKKRLSAALELWIDEMKKELDRAKANGYLRDDVNTRHVASFIVMAHEGFYGMLKGLDDTGVFRALHASLKRYFETIATPRRPGSGERKRKRSADD